MFTFALGLNDREHFGQIADVRKEFLFATAEISMQLKQPVPQVDTGRMYIPRRQRPPAHASKHVYLFNHVGAPSRRPDIVYPARDTD